MFHEIFQKGVLKYFKIFVKFLNISKWNISSCIYIGGTWWRTYRRTDRCNNSNRHHLLGDASILTRPARELSARCCCIVMPRP